MANGLVYDTLNSLLDDCVQYFNENHKSVSDQSILTHLKKIQCNLTHVQPLAQDFIGKYAHNYDVVPGLEANGYRSLLAVVESLLLVIIQMLRTIQTERGKTFFRGNVHVDKLNACSDILHQLRSLLYYAQILIGLTPNGELFIDEDDSEPLMHDCEIMAKACFYGSLHGFQYLAGIQPVVNSLSMFVASYNDVHQPGGTWKTVKSAINSGRYMVSPELRGEKLEKVYNGGDVQFFKKFWSLNEQGIVKVVPNLVGTSVQVNRIFKIPTNSFTLNSCKEDEEVVKISFTSSLGSPKPVKARLISSVLREGQDDVNSPSEPDKGFDKSKVGFHKRKAQSKSKNLVFFCHGGGFIALTSKSYELILRQWSKDLDCPIFSVDYSLAPEAPFPEGFEECFFAYAWAIKNAHKLGTTAENIVFAGDSAGGNLVLSVAIRAAVYGIRVPDTVVAMYPACIVRYSASPARLLSVMDPLLPLGVLSGCLGAYSGVKTERVKRQHSVTTDTSAARQSRPTSPSRQPVDIRAVSNFFRDVGEGFDRITNKTLTAKTKAETRTWWDDEFDVVDPDEINFNHGTTKETSSHVHSNNNTATTSSSNTDNNNIGRSKSMPEKMHRTSSLPCMDFKLKLPGQFHPLKSKFCGDNFKMHQSPVVKNAFVSPALASDDLIQTLPHVDIVGCEFDPLFDDSVVLAKRLESLGKSYQFHVVRGLPHGFLNFQVSEEPRNAAKMCLDLIQKGLQRNSND